MDGYWRPQYWATREAFTGKPADNEVPVVEFFRVRRSPNGHAAGEWVEVALVYKDKENANCRVEFAGNLRSLPWPQKDEVHRFESRPGDRPDRWMVRMPDKPGAWKFYALVYDPAGNLGAATTSVIVRAAK